MNAHFWTWHNGGWVKLTLKPGQTLSHCVSSPTDEGRDTSWQTGEYDKESLLVERYEGCWGYDCDGRYRREYGGFCPLDELRSRTANDGTLAPAWRQLEESHRGYTAETAGY